ncbi:S-adenosyl-L-methionine-dependent methyltransferase [Xylariaceae sp. FL1272]|nr:S-adenosyl-L-methionine-dependent methyltransferase [Xylariaceae sp. FL1272]
MSIPRISELSTRISTSTARICEYLSSNGIPFPSFSIDAPLYGAVPDVPEMQMLRRSIIDDTAELRRLMLGPRDYLTDLAIPNTLLPLQAVTRFGLARTLPVGDEMTFSRMAEGSGLTESSTKKIVRFAIAMKIFEEASPGVVRHNAASQLLAEDAELHDYVATCTDELWQAASQTCNAMVKFPGSEEPSETGFSLANNTDKPLYDFLAQFPKRSTRFANMMEGFTKGKAFDLKYVTDYYPWEKHSGGTVVDVGGSRGSVSIALARKNPSISFIVQDLETVIAAAKISAPSDVAGEVKFQVHDFFIPQPVVGADIYFFRWIFHNWSDKYCIKILRSLIPALKPGSKIIISDTVMPPANQIPNAMNYRLRGFDLVMTSIQNSKEREVEDWVELFRLGDKRFDVESIIQPPGSFNALLVAVWRGS